MANNDGASAAAQSTRLVSLAGKQYELSKMTYRDLQTAKEQACSLYRRSFLKTFSENSDLLPAESRATAIQEAFDRAEQFTPDSLPNKKVWVEKVDTSDPSGKKNLLNTGERFYHKQAKTWIEAGAPFMEEQEVNYGLWWLSQTEAGVIFGIWLSLRKCQGQEGITIDQFTEMFAVASKDEQKDFVEAMYALNASRLGNE